MKECERAQETKICPKNKKNPRTDFSPVFTVLTEHPQTTNNSSLEVSPILTQHTPTLYTPKPSLRLLTQSASTPAPPRKWFLPSLSSHHHQTSPPQLPAPRPSRHHLMPCPYTPTPLMPLHPTPLAQAPAVHRKLHLRDPCPALLARRCRGNAGTRTMNLGSSREERRRRQIRLVRRGDGRIHRGLRRKSIG